MATNPCMQEPIGQCWTTSSTTPPYRIKKALTGENCTVNEPKDYLHSRDMELVLYDKFQYKQLTHNLIAQQPELWNEDDIGE